MNGYLFGGACVVVLIVLLYDSWKGKNNGDYFHDYRPKRRGKETDEQ